jgi:dipeptidyl-peptidase 4
MCGLNRLLHEGDGLMKLRITSGRMAVAIGLALLVAAGAPAAQTTGIRDLRTHAEASGFKEYTPYTRMMEYLQAVQARSLEMRLSTYGVTHSDRELPYAIFSRPTVTQPWEAWALGKPIVVFAAGVHGGERTLRESVLIMIRELATPGSDMNKLLDSLVIIVVPQINPDGFSAEPNPTRGNLWGLDLNRDYMKLEQPEIQGYVQNVILRWAPHLFIDGHNGGSWPYNLNYQCGSHAAHDQRITQLCDQEIFPAIDRRLEKDGFRAWYYTGGNQEEWRVGGSEPRIGRNYGAFANSVGILFESPGGQPMEIGVGSGLLGYKAVAEWSAANGKALIDTVHRARRETIALGETPGDSVALEVRYEPEDYPVNYLIGEGQGDERKMVEVKGAKLMKKPVATIERPRPYAYVLPREATAAVDLLRQHSITVEQLREPTTLTVAAYTVKGVTHAPQYNHAATTSIEVGEVINVERTFPAGTYVVRTAQMQGRVAVHLLEAETSDNVIYWNRMDAWIPRPGPAAAQTQTDPDDDPPAVAGRGGGRGAGPGGGRGGGRGAGPGGQGRGGQQGPAARAHFQGDGTRRRCRSE